MALSRSLEKAQAITLCQFCEESPEIKYKCVDCDLLLCQICNSILHRKKAYTEHAVFNLKDHGTTQAAETVRKVDLRNMPCDEHLGEKCCVFCSECEVPICPNCLTQSHSNHKYKELKEVYGKMTAEIVDFTVVVENDLQFFKNEETKLKSTLSQGEQRFEDTKKKIIQQEAKLKDSVTKQAKELLHDLETKWLPTEEKLRKEIKIATESEKALESRKSSLEEALQSHQAKYIFTTGKSLDKTLPNKTETNIRLKEIKFIPAKKDNHSRDMVFGNLYQVPNMQVVQSYQSNLPSVTKILSVKDNVYIGNPFDKKLLKTNLDLKNFQVLSEVKDIQVYDMAVTNNGGTLISTRRNEIQLYQKDEKITTFHSFSPLLTLGLHINKQNDILVGLCESYNLIPPNTDSIRKVISLTNKGDIKHTYEYDQHNQRLFTWPGRITTNDSLIYIVDMCNAEGEGRVVAIDKGGQLQWTYTGCHTAPNQKFYPRDMAITSADLILITDCDNHAIHVVTCKGETITYNCLKELKIELPLSLDLDRNGLLLIGCDCYKLNKDKRAMIYQVKLT